MGTIAIIQLFGRTFSPHINVQIVIKFLEDLHVQDVADARMLLRQRCENRSRRERKLCVSVHQS
jgi:hypothetical protein